MGLFKSKEEKIIKEIDEIMEIMEVAEKHYDLSPKSAYGVAKLVIENRKAKMLKKIYQYK